MELRRLLILKKLLCIILTTLFAASVIYGYTWLNLKECSVYYAKHTPHREDIDPVLMEVVRNLYWIDKPADDAIDYDFDACSNILNSHYKKGRTIALFGYSPSDEYHYASEDELSTILMKISSYTVSEILMEITTAPQSVDMQQLHQEIYRVVQPVIDIKPEPSINLQWLYD